MKTNGSHLKEAAAEFPESYTVLFSPEEVVERLTLEKPMHTHTAFARIGGNYFFGLNHPYMTEGLISQGVYTWEDLFTIEDQQWGYISRTSEGPKVQLLSGTKGSQDQSKLPEVTQQLSDLLGVDLLSSKNWVPMREASRWYWKA